MKKSCRVLVVKKQFKMSKRSSRRQKAVQDVKWRAITSVELGFEIVFNIACRYFGDDNFIRVAHALETLTVLLREIFKKRFNEQVRVLSVLILFLPNVRMSDL